METLALSLRLLHNAPFAAPVSADNRRMEKPPCLCRAVPVLLRISLFAAGSSTAAGKLAYADLAAYPALRLAIAQDFDQTTTPLVTSDAAGHSIDPETGDLLIPVSAMNTKELMAYIGTRERADLKAELQMGGNDIDQIAPSIVLQFPISIQNRIGDDGTLTPTPVVSDLCVQSARDAIEAATEAASFRTQAKEAAETAQGVVDTVQAAAEAAQVYATNAANAAETAQVHAQSALSSANAASASANDAASSATAGATNAATAAASAEEANTAKQDAITAKDDAKAYADDAKSAASIAGNCADDAREAVANLQDYIALATDLKEALEEYDGDADQY